MQSNACSNAHALTSEFPRHDCMTMFFPVPQRTPCSLPVLALAFPCCLFLRHHHCPTGRIMSIQSSCASRFTMLHLAMWCSSCSTSVRAHRSLQRSAHRRPGRSATQKAFESLPLLDGEDGQQVLSGREHGKHKACES